MFKSRLKRGEDGQTLVEYALIIALVSLAAIAALGFLSGKIQQVFSKSANTLNNVEVSSAAGVVMPPGPTVPHRPERFPSAVARTRARTTTR